MGDVQSYRNGEEPLLRWCIVCALVDLFPHCQIVVGTTMHVRLERYTSDIMEHKVVELHLSSGPVAGSGRLSDWTHPEIDEID